MIMTYYCRNFASTISKHIKNIPWSNHALFYVVGIIIFMRLARQYLVVITLCYYWQYLLHRWRIADDVTLKLTLRWNYSELIHNSFRCFQTTCFRRHNNVFFLIVYIKRTFDTNSMFSLSFAVLKRRWFKSDRSCPYKKAVHVVMTTPLQF